MRSILRIGYLPGGAGISLSLEPHNNYQAGGPICMVAARQCLSLPYLPPYQSYQSNLHRYRYLLGYGEGLSDTLSGKSKKSTLNPNDTNQPVYC